MSLFGDSFEPIVGHERVIESVRVMLNRQRLPHALLFGGPEGIGKRTTAFALARMLLFEGEHVSDETLLSHADCHHLTIDEKSRSRQIKVDQARHLLHRTRQTRGSGLYQVVLVDSANDLNTETANLLLKFLEEPSEGTVILLLSDQPNAILPTIRSRCAHLRFLPLSEQQCRQVLEQQDFAQSIDATLVALAEGRPGWIARMSANSWWPDFLSIFGQIQDETRAFPTEPAIFALLRKVDEASKAEILQKLALARLQRSGLDAGNPSQLNVARLESDVRLWETLTDFRSAAEGLYLDPKHADGRLARLLTSP